MTDEEIKSVEAVLGKPVAAELNENALKVRRNLLFFGFISIFIALGEVRLDPTSSIIGLKFYGISDGFVRKALLVTNIYMFIHFAWYVIDSLMEWRIRITGTRLSFITGARMLSPLGDYPDDPRQSSLYHWWVNNSRKIGNLQEGVGEINEKISDLWQQVKKIPPGERTVILGDSISSLSQVLNGIQRLSSQIEEAKQTISSTRIPVSLQRFDSWFFIFQTSQNFRWLLLDSGLPIVVGIASIWLLMNGL